MCCKHFSLKHPAETAGAEPLVQLMWPCKHGYTREGDYIHSVANETGRDLFLNVRFLKSQNPVLHTLWLKDSFFVF